MTTHHRIAADTGNGTTNAARAMSRNHKTVNFPSIRARVTGDTLGIAGEQEIAWNEWGGTRYAVGEDAVRSGQQLEQHGGSSRYGNELHQHLTAAACAELGVKGTDKDPDTVHLVTFAPPKFYLQAKRQIADGYLSGGGMTALYAQGDKRPRVWQYTQVDVYPEGLIAAACMAYDDSGKPVETDLLAGDVLVLDGGMNTIDAVLLQNGSFNPETLQHATWAKTGIQFQILEPMLGWLQKKSPDYSRTTIHDLDIVLRRGLTSGDWTLYDGIHDRDLKLLFDKFGESIASRPR